MIDYDIILEKEVLKEKAAEVLADLLRILRNCNIKDEELNEIILNTKDKVSEIYRNIFKEEYSNMEKLNEVNKELDIAKEIILRIEEVING